jgi:hypothetical protein
MGQIFVEDEEAEETNKQFSLTDFMRGSSAP